MKGKNTKQSAGEGKVKKSEKEIVERLKGEIERLRQERDNLEKEITQFIPLYNKDIGL